MSRDRTSEELHFIDSNIFFYSKIMDSEFGESCADVLRKIEDGKIAAATSTLVVLEVANALRKFGFARQVRDTADSIFSLKIAMLEMTSSDVRNAIETCQGLNISPYDCAHVAVMRRAGIRKVISADKDFDHVPDIRRRDPKIFRANSDGEQPARQHPE